MSGVLKIEIIESEESLKKLLNNQRIGKKKERIQILYLIKTHQAETVGHLAALTRSSSGDNFQMVEPISRRGTRLLAENWENYRHKAINLRSN